ncbi:MAG: Chemotaxis protein CheD [Olavius algarvensis Delta 4 endosymbiont]|nr:MAG: Chemotaxis protein CheD [Olavius algarvensis Delta 4 endosymbiont]
MEIVVGVSDMKISNDPRATIVTYSLGSCIGVTLYDPVVKVGGLLHYQLPDSGLNVKNAQREPCRYADTAIPAFFRTAYRLGALKQRLKVVMVGGSSLMDENSHFDIGQRNYLAARKLFYRNNVLTDFEDIGGSSYRTVRLELESGRTIITGPSRRAPLSV